MCASPIWFTITVSVFNEVNKCDTYFIFLICLCSQVGTVDPVGDFQTIISQRDEDRFDEGVCPVKLGCLCKQVACAGELSGRWVFSEVSNSQGNARKKNFFQSHGNIFII